MKWDHKNNIGTTLFIGAFVWFLEGGEIGAICGGISLGLCYLADLVRGHRK
jgi:hypothetical protein